MVLTRVGYTQELALLEEVANGAYQLESFSAADVVGAGVILRKYKDLGIGLADASSVILADRHDILTLD